MWTAVNQKLRWMARPAELRGVLQLPPIFIAAGLCGFRAGLSRQHRVRTRLAQWRLHGRGRQRCQGRLDVGELFEDTALRRYGPRWACGGLSYGGFFTLIAMTDQPKLFPCRRGRGRCRRLRDVLIGSLITGTGPRAASEHRSRIRKCMRMPRRSRISIGWSGPLLVLHGTSDVNVPYLESVWLIDEALKKGKGELLSYMMYPGEFHYFTRAHILLDAWHRVDDFLRISLARQNQGDVAALRGAISGFIPSAFKYP